jgi:hypothetical protein
MANNNKKFKIITTIDDDAPAGNINWCTISFLTPQKLEKIKYLDVKGFKVHDGYNTGELANDDAKKIKEKNKNHDVYLSQLGKIYAWDDATKTDSVEYDDEKLNDLEKTRRENIDKIKLMGEQFDNEYKTLHANTNTDRIEAQKKRIQKKLYEKGLITQKEYEMIQEENKPVKEIKEMTLSLEKINVEMEECYKTDYLDENDQVGLKYGCISIYSPQHIKGLKTLCFKIRGLFQTMPELDKRIKKLQTLYPNDRIYRFEIGKWCPYTENDSIDGLILLKQLNYSMKCHLDNMEHEKEEFEKRKESLMQRTEQESKLIKEENRREKRKAKRDAAKKKKMGIIDPVAQTQTNNEMPVDTITSLGNAEDDKAIQKILDYLDDPELRNKFAADKSKLETMELDASQT